MNISKILLVGVSLFYLIIGIGFTSVVLTHFEKSKQECLNPNNKQLQQHPELTLFEQCIYKTYPFKSFNFWKRNDNENSVNCNCRQLLADLSLLNATGDNYNNNNSMLDSLLQNWDMLEILRITDDNVLRFSLNLSRSYHYNSVYLKILHLENIEITSLGNSIDNWKYLEYFYLSHAHFIDWPQSFDKLEKMSFFKLENAYVSRLPNLCTMNNLRAIYVQQSISSENKISQLPDCIVELNLLHSMIFYFLQIDSLPVGLFTMTNIKEIGLVYTDTITFNTLIDVINKTIVLENEFKWNDPSQTTISFDVSTLCVWYSGEITPTSQTYTHTQLEYASLLKQFISDTNACKQVCEYGTIEKFSCTPFEWQNGVCNDECNVQSCIFDGGDCNQLCQEEAPNCYSFGLFTNGICDIACNTSSCDYDKYECISYSYDNITFGNNVTHCDGDNKCPIEWVDDQWCDNYCFTNENCYNDGKDCICNENTDDESNGCQQLLEILIQFGLSEADYQIPCSSIVTLWNFFDETDWDEATVFSNSQIQQNSFLALLDLHSEGLNATMACQYMDIDANNFISINELLITFSQAYNLTSEKAQQIDCTRNPCLHHHQTSSCLPLT